MSARRATACIIGAGSSGITAAQVLQAEGIDFDCFEMGSEVGGNWRYDNDNGVSSAYRSLHINTSREAMEYAAWPMPASLPDYPSHWQIAGYFDDFVDHFGLREAITFRTEVTKVAQADSGGWDVTIRPRDDARAVETRHYDHVLVANGHHWDPRWPEPSFPGSETFPGEQIHAHYYRTPEVLDGRTVVVLGIGNSATDIAVEASRNARETYLAMRRGAWILPKYLFGMPTDHLTDSPLARGPLRLQKLGMRTMLRIAVGRMTDYGLPQPDHDVLEAHPTVSDDLLSRLGHGDITVKPTISRFEGSTVVFADGSTRRRRRGRLLHRLQGDVPVPRRVRAGHRRQPRRPVPSGRSARPPRAVVHRPGAAARRGDAAGRGQAHWVADLINGRVTLPPRAEMRAQIAAYDAALRKRFVASKRHTIEVDFHAYRVELEKERKTRAVSTRRLRLSTP